MTITDQLDRLSSVLDKLIGSEPTKAGLTIEERLRIICDKLENVNIGSTTKAKELTVGNTTLTESDLKKLKELIDE